MQLLLFFDVTGSKKMILGEMINFAKKVACIQFTFYVAFIQFTLTLYGPVKSPFLDLQNMMLLKNSWQSSFRFEKKNLYWGLCYENIGQNHLVEVLYKATLAFN